MNLAKKYVRELTQIKNQFDPTSTGKKERLVELLIKEKSITDSDLIKLHETLLFLKAHPSHKRLLRSVSNLQKKTNNNILQSIQRRKEEGIFEQTGVAGTCITATFSYTLVVWLSKEYPKHIYFDSFGATEDLINSVISSLLPLSLKEHFSDEKTESFISWMEEIAGKDKRNQLQFLLQIFSVADLSIRTASQLMEQLELYIRIDLAKLPSRSTITGLKQTPFYHKEELLRTFNLKEIIQTYLPQSTPLSLLDKKRLTESIRFQLISLYRETDPGTNTDFDDISLYRLERGLDVVLLGMDSTHRLPIDTYIGFFAFKNQIPYAYGGTWLLGSTAKIGLNIFPSYRGGESTWFFAQLMRVYYQEFKPDYFIAEPYQIGRGNPEGIASGAFWFYYKLGFRSLTHSHRLFASKEFDKLSSGKRKKTPKKTLEKLVEDEMVLAINKNIVISKTKFDTMQLSASITHFIRNKFNGNLEKAIQQSLSTLMTELNIKNKEYFLSLTPGVESIALSLFAAGGIKLWSKKEKGLLLDLIEEKSFGTDSNYAKKLNAHKSLLRLLQKLSK